MKEHFNIQAAYTPEQTRHALSGKTMVEEEAVQPAFKPSLSLSQGVDNQHYSQRLADERTRLKKYQQRVTEPHTTFRINGKVVASKTERHVLPLHHVKREVTDNFNMHASQSHDLAQLGLSL
jgi:hypothetical protein